jgi:hypothetical protein
LCLFNILKKLNILNIIFFFDDNNIYLLLKNILIFLII